MLAVFVFAVLVGLASRLTMAAEQRQQTPFGTADLIMQRVLSCRRERLGKIERQVDRHQCVDGERHQAEPRGPLGA